MVSDLVANTEDRFFHDMAQLMRQEENKLVQQHSKYERNHSLDWLDTALQFSLQECRCRSQQSSIEPAGEYKQIKLRGTTPAAHGPS